MLLTYITENPPKKTKSHLPKNTLKPTIRQGRERRRREQRIKKDDIAIIIRITLIHKTCFSGRPYSCQLRSLSAASETETSPPCTCVCPKPKSTL